MMDGKTGDNISEDFLLDRRVCLHQPIAGYRTALDPVLLAAAIDPQFGTRLLDLGCGVGGAALCVLARLPDMQISGIEIQPKLAELARGNAARNGHDARLPIITGDCLDPACIPPASFDQIMTNPPYHDGHSTPSPDAPKALATHERDAATSVGAWIGAARRALRPRGALTLIYRADRLDLLLAALGHGFGAITVIPIWPRAGQPAKRVVVRAIKDSRARLTLTPGLILHTESAAFTAEAEALLRHLAALP